LTHVTLSDRIDRMMKNQLRKTEPLLALLGLAAFLVACQQAPSAPEIPPPPVVVATAETRDVTLTREFTGNTVGFETVEIQARVSGYLESIDFEPSTMVKKGQRLFVIEPAPYEAVRDRAEASLKSAEAGLRRAESDLERLEQAVKTNAVSQQEVTRARAERDQAEASLLGSQAALRDAEIQLAYTSVTSPITGIIGRNLVDQGNLVGPGGTTLLARVIRVDPIFAYFDVDERTVVQTLQQLGGIDAERRTESDGVRDRLELVLEGVETTFEGRADYIDNQVDADTGTIQVRGFSRIRTWSSCPGSSSACGFRWGSSPAPWSCPKRRCPRTSAGATCWSWVMTMWSRSVTSSPDRCAMTGCGSSWTGSTRPIDSSPGACSRRGPACR
jgi:RND family efflux transporter MFP subunit